MLSSREYSLSLGSLFLGRYEVVSELGAGTFARVYKARQLSTGQEVAIKVLRSPGDSAGGPTGNADRFRREMRLCAELSHPNIVRLIDSGEADDGLVFAVFQYVPGSTLREILDEEGKLSLQETAHLMSQVIDALSCAHARGVVHRDLKPENIVVTKAGARRNALVLDFGLGGFARDAEAWQMLPRITTTQEMMGTPCYAAPEQLRGESPSTRSDLYSWGLIFLECLTGALAVSGGSPQEVLLKQLGPEPIPVPRWLRGQQLGRLLEAVTAKQVERRGVTIEELLETLRLTELTELAAHGRHGHVLPEGERRQLTIICCRLIVTSIDGSTLDPEEVDQLFHAQQGAISELAERSGGRIASIMADRILLVFGYPQARENDARRAARTALQIVGEVHSTSERLEPERRHRLDVRVGVHTGLVIVRELRRGSRQDLYDVVGLTPQIATRLEELSGPGEVLVSSDTVRLLRNAMGVQPVGEHRLDELCGIVSVFRLTSDAKTDPDVEGVPAMRETPLVGRTHQLTQLLERWEQAQQGNAAAVLITGEPGIGKSRLLRELRRRVAATSWLEGRCVPERQDSPLGPIVDLLTSLPQPIDVVLTRYGFDLAENLPLFAALLSIPLDDRYPPLQLTPDRQKELTLEALVALLLRMAQERPIVFALEDLHWADPTTLELAALIVREVQSARVLETRTAPRLCAVFTARPAFAPTWSIEDMVLIPLSRLGRPEVEEMVAAGLASGKPIPPGVLEQITRHADGVPLFVEEVTRILLESVPPDRADQLVFDDVALEIPSSLRDLLAARLDGLSPGAREMAQLAAVLGREFRYELLSAVSGKDNAVLREDLRELTDAGLVYPRTRARAESYLFKHALIRDAAYETMTRSRRRTIHSRVAVILRERFPDIAQDQPEVLAQHFERGGDAEAAITYRARSGDRAMSRGAYVEAIRHLQRALRLLERQPNRAQLREQELGLLQSLGMGLLATQGYAAPAVEEVFERAFQMCREFATDIPFRVLHGLWGVQMVRSDREATAELLPKFHLLAKRSGDPAVVLAAHVAEGVRAFFTADFIRARDEMTKGTAYYDTAAVQRWIREHGYDGGMYTFGYLLWTLWILGYPDQAVAVRDRMLSHAEAASNPYSLALALAFGGCLAHDRGDPTAAREASARSIALATEQKLYLWLAIATCVAGWAALREGNLEEGIAQAQGGLDVIRAVGMRTAYPYYLSFLVEGHLKAGAVDKGLAAVDEGLHMSATLLDCFYEAELHRLRGELLLCRGETAEAEACFQRALALARRHSAKSFELRAAMSLGRLLRDRGRPNDARRLVQGAYDWFSEGFESRDLREARALLQEVA